MSQKLGQHFLKNKLILKKITQTLDLEDGDFIIEIGPGHGELTKEIISDFERRGIKDYRLIGIEKDRLLASSVLHLTSSKRNAEIIEGDVLKILPILHTKYKPQDMKYKIVGNIPYYITGHLFRIIGELKNKPSRTVLLIQKEVAQKVCAKAPESSLLSLSVQFWADCKIIEHVPKKYFSPPPKVDSTVIKLVTKRDIDWENANKYYSFLKKAFKQPRKTLLNNLVYFGLKKEKIIEIMVKFSLNIKARPQDLSYEDASSLSLLF